MRFVFILFIFFATLIQADEIQRIESIVEDISKLRNSYVKVERELQNEKDKNKKYTKKIDSLENEIISLKKQIKTKEKIVINTSVVKPLKSKNQTVAKKCLNNTINTESNTFPKLSMKKSNMSITKQKVFSFKASTYRVNKLAYIYGSIDGEIVDEWEELRSFTSNQRNDTWIKITGYFIDKKWRPAETPLWVESKDTNLRAE